MQFVDLSAPLERYGPDVQRRMQAVFAHGGFIMGPEVFELEAALAHFVGVEYAITVASGTHALELALRALGIGPGDEVITVPFTWISTAEAIALVGAKPVFVDIEPHGFNLDPQRLAAAITPRTRAILPVSLFGQMAELETIAPIAARHNLAVIEDGAQSFGASRYGRRSCGATLLGCTSFFPTKPLGCYGDGGALFTNDSALAEQLRALRIHGSSARHQHTVLGTNARLDTLQAAALLAKLPYFEHELAERARIAWRYSEALAGLVEVPRALPGNTHVYAQYTLRAAQRDQLQARLKARGVPSAVYYPRCLHQQPVFATLAGGATLPESERAAREVLSLPMHAYLSESDQARVIDAVQRALT
jgi:UDP-2-acetamido-2-deoxy-ribo-hexuluronate aminotransferase